MLNKVLPINQLPYNIESQLQPVGDFYVCTRFTENMIGDPVVKIGEDIYYRFMHYVYLPQPPESLTTEQVIDICNLRLDYINELVDQNHNRHVVAAIVDCVAASLTNATSPIKALDFGCGSGLSSKLLMEHIPSLQIVGVDISEKAVIRSRQQGLMAFLTHPEGPLPFEAATFDVIFAVFVMHFNIIVETLVELRRILRYSGKFVFNVYQRDIDGVIEQLREAGFSSIDVWDSLFDIDANHMIVSCGILPPYKTVFHRAKKNC
jgi:ubiquinone/menaquinone biosynthesis C-methylase UbiE